MPHDAANVTHRHTTSSPQASSASYGVYSAIRRSSEERHDASPPASRVATIATPTCASNIPPTHPTNKPLCLSSHLSSVIYDIYRATNHNYEPTKHNETRKTSHHNHQIKSTSNTRQTNPLTQNPQYNLYGYDYWESSHREGIGSRNESKIRR